MEVTRVRGSFATTILPSLLSRDFKVIIIWFTNERQWLLTYLS